MVYFCMTNGADIYCYVILVTYVVPYELSDLSVFFKNCICLLIVLIFFNVFWRIRNVAYANMALLEALKVIIQIELPVFTFKLFNS
jgi:hypothetical protein